MSDFEDHNPFQSNVEEVHSDLESSSNVDLNSEPSTPPAHPARIPTSPTSPGTNRNFVATQTIRQAAYRPPQQNFKSDFCCARDRWLHSGEDTEVQVYRLSSRFAIQL